MAATARFIQNIGNSVKNVWEKKGSSWWYNHHMKAASRAISERLPLVDIVVDVRDARIPLSSEILHLRNLPPSSRRIIVLNKMDLANSLRTKEWMAYFLERNCIPYAVNSHNKDNVKEFLNFLQARVRELHKVKDCTHTTTVMLLGIPNVGKSALANSLHQIGRISAADKGKLKHAIVSPQPGETKDITSLKIASHPNIYVLDTPGILPPEILDADVCSKLALTGAISDCLISESELAQYFLSILNSSDEHKKWAKICKMEIDKGSVGHDADCPEGSALDRKQANVNPSDHTQDFIVRNVRKVLFEEISSFGGNIEVEKDMVELIGAQFKALHNAFLMSGSGEHVCTKVATKLINLYRTGRLGHYTLDRLQNT